MSDVMIELDDVLGKGKKANRLAASAAARTARHQIKPIIKRNELKDAQEAEVRRQADLRATEARRAKAAKVKLAPK